MINLNVFFNVFVSTQLKWLNFLGQNDSIFSLSAPIDKIAVHYAYDQTFDFKMWIDPRKNSFERSVYESVHEKRIK